MPDHRDNEHEQPDDDRDLDDGDPGSPDHRRLGRRLGIFASDDRCGPGLPLWLPAGAAVRSEIERYVVDLERRYGYRHVYTPELAKRELYERSGHWGHYRDDMFPLMAVGGDDVVLRPMNCPHHVLVFEAERPSVRELPLRLAELGTMFRYERSGVVSGLSRVRQMTLNDGHVFCAPDQLEAEIVSIVTMVEEAYRALAIPPPRYRLSLPDGGPKYVDDAELWARSEAVLRSALDGLGVAYDEAPGEAAFYGPKLDLQVVDHRGREETLSTVQVDYHHPARFGLVAHHGAGGMRPVMIHRSVVSTMERMVAHLLEVHDGALPPWLAPVQVRVLPVVGGHDHAHRVVASLRAGGLRVELDDRDATLGSRVADGQRHRVPYLAVVGEREAAAGTVALRLRDGRRLDGLVLDRAVAGVVEVVGGRHEALWSTGRE
ncbi:MAG: threonine--tRNA ligase [Acidimicrobiales bacterium]